MVTLGYKLFLIRFSKKNSYDLTLKEASYIAVTLPNPKKEMPKNYQLILKKELNL